MTDKELKCKQRELKYLIKIYKSAYKEGAGFERWVRYRIRRLEEELKGLDEIK